MDKPSPIFDESLVLQNPRPVVSPQSKIKFCPQCGKKLKSVSPYAKGCKDCGVYIENSGTKRWYRNRQIFRVLIAFAIALIAVAVLLLLMEILRW
jgi:hypothetical protein